MWRALAEPWGAGGNNSCAVCEFGSESAELSVREGGGWSPGEGAGVSRRWELWLGQTQEVQCLPSSWEPAGARAGPAVPLAFLPAAPHRGWRTQGDGNALFTGPTIFPNTVSGSHLRVGGACPPRLPGGACWPFSSMLTFSLQVYMGFGKLWAALSLPAPSPPWWPLQA